MKTTVNTDGTPVAEPAARPALPPRDRIRQDKFSTLHLACFREKKPQKD